MKVLAAIPAYEGKVYCGCLEGMLESGRLFAGLYMPTGTGNLSAIRDTIAHMFLSTDSDVLFMIDADVGFSASAVLKVLAHIEGGETFVAGAIPYRNPTLQHLFIYEPEEKQTCDRTDVFPVKYAAGGFTAIHRTVFEKIVTDGWAVNYRPEPMAPEMYNFFPQPIVDGELLSEAYGVCFLAKLAGVRVILDTTTRLTHWGFSVFGHPVA